MPQESENKNPLLGKFSDSLSAILGPEKSHQLALTEEALRMASGGKPDQWDRMEGDLWLSRALRFAYDTLDGTFDFAADTLQKRLLDQMHAKNPNGGIWDMFSDAREVRRKALLDLASRALTDKPYTTIQKQIGESARWKVKALGVWSSVDPTAWESSEQPTPYSIGEKVISQTDFIDYREFAYLRLAMAMPEKILPSGRFREVMDLALLSGRGRELLSEIYRERARTKKGKKILGVDLNEIVMTLNWVNPDFPLWLATENALANMLRSVFELEEITESGARKMRNRKLLGKSPYPILKFRIFPNGKHKFELEQGLSAGEG